MARNYAAEYKYQGRPSQIRRRSQRNAARRKMVKAGRVRKGDGKDVGHRNGLDDGNSFRNLAVQSRRKNRSFPRTKRSAVRKHPV